MEYNVIYILRKLFGFKPTLQVYLQKLFIEIVVK